MRAQASAVLEITFSAFTATRTLFDAVEILVVVALWRALIEPTLSPLNIIIGGDC